MNLLYIGYEIGYIEILQNLFEDEQCVPKRINVEQMKFNKDTYTVFEFILQQGIKLKEELLKRQ
jgi:hypothetical protein